MAVISITNVLSLIKPHTLGDKVYYITPYGLVRAARIADVKVELSSEKFRVVICLKVRGIKELLNLHIGFKIPNRIYANRDRAKRHAPEVVKYFQEN